MYLDSVEQSSYGSAIYCQYPAPTRHCLPCHWRCYWRKSAPIEIDSDLGYAYPSQPVSDGMSSSTRCRLCSQPCRDFMAPQVLSEPQSSALVLALLEHERPSGCSTEWLVFLERSSPCVMTVLLGGWCLQFTKLRRSHGLSPRTLSKEGHASHSFLFQLCNTRCRPAAFLPEITNKQLPNFVFCDC